MKYLLLLCSIWFLPALLQGQEECQYYDAYIKKGDREMQKGRDADFKVALDAYNTAMLHCPEREEEAQNKILESFQAIERLRAEAEAASQEARAALNQVKQEKARTEEALQAAEQAEAKAKKGARISKNADETLRRPFKDALTLRMAEMNYLLHNESEITKTILKDLLVDSIKYSYEAKYDLYFEHPVFSTPYFSPIVSPDGEHLLFRNTGGHFMRYNLKSQDKTLFHGCDFLLAHTVVFSPDGEKVLSGIRPGGDGTIQIWNKAGQKTLEFIGHERAVASAAFTHDGENFLTVSMDSIGKLWISRGQLLHTYYDLGLPSFMIFSPKNDGAFLTSDLTLRNLKGEKVQNFSGLTEPVVAAALSPQGNNVLACSSKDAILWSIRGKELVRFSLPGESFSSITFTRDGQRILSGMSNGKIILWNLKGDILGIYYTERKHGNVSAVVPVENDQYFLAVHNEVKTYNIPAYHISLELPYEKTYLDGYQEDEAAVFSPGGQTILSSSEEKCTIWNDKGQKLTEIKKGAARWGSHQPLFSLNGKKILIFPPFDEGSSPTQRQVKGIVEIWNSKGDSINRFRASNSEIMAAAFSPDGKTLATASKDDIKIWDIDGQLLDSLNFSKYNSGNVFQVCFSPGGNYLLINSSKSVEEINTITGSKKKINYGFNTLWDLLNQEIQFSYERKNIQRPYAIFPHDGKSILAGSLSSDAILLNLKGDSLLTLRNAGIPKAISNDGKWILTKAGKLKLWHEYNEIKNIDNNVHWSRDAATFSADGRFSVFSHEEGALMTYPTPEDFFARYVRDIPIEKLIEAGLDITNEEKEKWQKGEIGW